MRNLELTKRADNAFDKKQFRKAKRLYLKALDEAPTEYLYVQLTRCALNLNQLNEVEVLGRKALAINPQNEFALLTIARSFLLRKMVTEAEQEVNKALAINNDLGDAHAVLASIKMIEGNLDLAEREIQTALHIDRECSFTHTVYGAFLRTNKRTREALKEFFLAFTFSPSFGTGMNLFNQFLVMNRIVVFVIVIMSFLTGLIFRIGYLFIGLSMFYFFAAINHFRYSDKCRGWLGIAWGIVFIGVAYLFLF